MLSGQHQRRPIGPALVQHPDTKASGDSGELDVERVLFKLCAQRSPLPFALRKRGTAIDKDRAAPPAWVSPVHQTVGS